MQSLNIEKYDKNSDDSSLDILSQLLEISNLELRPKLPIPNIDHHKLQLQAKEQPTYKDVYL